MRRRPQFNTLWSGDWPYDYDLGVGIELTGIPTNQEGFLQELEGRGCHISAGRRVLERLLASGITRTTISPTANFNAIALELIEFGVTVKIVPPLNAV